MWANIENLNRCPVAIYNVYQSIRPFDYCGIDNPFYIATNTINIVLSDTTEHTDCQFRVSIHRCPRCLVPLYEMTVSASWVNTVCSSRSWWEYHHKYQHSWRDYRHIAFIETQQSRISQLSRCWHSPVEFPSLWRSCDLLASCCRLFQYWMKLWLLIITCL